MEIEDLIVKLITYFPEDIYNLHKFKVDSDGVDVIFRDKEGKICVEFQINTTTKNLFIDSLSKCTKSGTENIKRVEDFAKSINIQSIYLTDESEIQICNRNISFSLATLNILATGTSWYNKLGYYSSMHENNQSLNNHTFLLKKLVNVLIELGLYKTKYEKYFVYFDSLFPNETRYQVFNKTVQEVFIKVKEYIFEHREQCYLQEVYKKMAFFAKVINKFSDLLFYEKELIKTLKYGGKKKHCSQKKRKNLKKNKNTIKSTK